MNFPMVFDVDGKRVVVAGGGAVATRRIGRLVAAGADVCVVSPTLTDELERLANAGRIEWHQRGYRAGDLEGAALVFCATDDASVNRRVASAARRQKIPINVADRSAPGDFSVPAVAELGALRLAIDTGGAGPAISRALRRHLQRDLSSDWARGVELAGRLRPLLQDRADAEPRAEFWRLFADGLPDGLAGDEADVRAWLSDIADEAGVDLPDFEFPPTD